jgi:hypothetical protein
MISGLLSSGHNNAVLIVAVCYLPLHLELVLTPTVYAVHSSIDFTVDDLCPIHILLIGVITCSNVKRSPPMLALFTSDVVC